MLLAILTTIGTGCGNKKQKYYVNLTVEVKDSSTNQPITGANVAGAGKTGSTDASGYVMFSNIEGNKKHSFTVKAREYNDYSFNINVEKQSLSYTAYLSKQKGTITGVVFDHNKNPLEGATISIPNTVITTKSNGDGSFILNDVPVSSKPYTLDVTKENYGTRKVYNVLVTSEKPNYNVPEIILSNEPGKLKGTVIEEGGSPLANVDILISEANETTITDSRGSYSIDLLPGEYTVILSHQQYQTVTKYLVKINSNKDTVLNAELKPKPGALAGNVIDDNNRAIDNVRVTLIGTNYFNITDTSGYFYIDGIKPGDYNVSFTHELYKDSSAIVNINKAEETRLNNFKLSPKTGTLQGSVIDQNTEAPIKGAIVKSLTTLDSTTTESNGAFALENIRIGEHRISVTATDYSKVEFNKTVREGINNIEEKIQLFKDPGKIYGTVIDKITNNPVEGAVVTLIEDVSVTATTNEQGVFYLDNLAEGIYSIRIEKEYYKREDITGINVTPKKAENIGTIYLETLPCTVAGKTTPGAIVKLQSTSHSATASETGRFIINNVNPGNYVLEITKTDYEAKSIDISLEPAQTLELGNIPLTKLKGTITGTVKDSITQMVLQNVTVTVMELPTVNVKTNASGVFNIGNLEVGRYTLKFDYTNYISQNKANIDVIANQTKDIGTINLVPKPGKIQGTTTPGAQLNLRETSYSTTANGTGAFILDNIQPGEYTLDISLTNYNSKSIPITLSANETKNIGSQPLSPIPGKITGLTNASTVSIIENGKQASVTDGTFTITNLAPGTYTLKYTRSGYIPKTKVVKVTPNGTTDAGNVTLEPEYGSITGYISCTNGNITLVERKETQYYNNPAYFKFDKLEPGTYHLTLQKPDYQSVFYTVKVEPGKTTDMGNIDVGRKLDGVDGDKIEDKSKTWRLTKPDELNKHIPILNENDIMYPQEIIMKLHLR